MIMVSVKASCVSLKNAVTRLTVRPVQHTGRNTDLAIVVTTMKASCVTGKPCSVAGIKTDFVMP